MMTQSRGLFRLIALASLLVAPLACKSGSHPTTTVAQVADLPEPAAPAEPTTEPAAELALSPTTAPTTIPAREIAELKEDVAYLASDGLEGRGVGTKGLDEAADYIAARFRSLGLKPVKSCPDYYQNFSMTTATSVDPSSTFSVGETKYELSTQFTPLGFTSEGDFAGPVAFVGYGISDAKDHQYDDYTDIDVKGKVVLLLRYEPHNEKGTSRFAENDWSEHASLNAKAEAAAAHGAAAVLLVNPPKFHGADRFVPIARGGAKSSIPFLQIKRELADDLLKRAGVAKNLETLQTEIDTTAKPQSFDLKDVHVSGHAAIQRKKVPVKNVLAYLPGLEHRDEFIVVGAHYDHLGRGAPGSLARGSHDIHHGADDNASGTTAVLDLAERMVYSSMQRRDRSVLFILFTGEEEGLIGSQYFVDHPPVKLENIVAMLNMDMVGRIRNETVYVGGVGTAEPFESMLKSADDASPLQVKSIGKGGYGPSDHMSFAMKKIPVLFLFSGMHSDYHTPTDTADKVNYDGISEVVDFAQYVVDAMEKMPRQQYVATFDSQAMSLGGSGSRGGTRVSLGVVPDYGTDESTVGVRITGTSSGSPAEKAGLREGDVILQIDKKKIDNLYDLTDFLAKAKPGDEVTITVQRGDNKEHVELHAKLAERKQEG